MEVAVPLPPDGCCRKAIFVRSAGAQVRLSSPPQAAWFAWTPGGRGHAHAHRHIPVARLPLHQGLLVCAHHACTFARCKLPMRPHDAPSRRSQQANQDVLRHHVHRRVKVVAGHAMPGDTSGPIITLWPWPHGNARNAYRAGCRVGHSAAAHSPVSSHACSRASPLLTHFAHPLCGAAGASGSSCRTLPPGSRAVDG